MIGTLFFNYYPICILVVPDYSTALGTVIGKDIIAPQKIPVAMQLPIKLGM